MTDKPMRIEASYLDCFLYGAAATLGFLLVNVFSCNLCMTWPCSCLTFSQPTKVWDSLTVPCSQPVVDFGCKFCGKNTLADLSHWCKEMALACMPQLKVKYLTEQPPLAYSREGDAGLDLRWSGSINQSDTRFEAKRCWLNGRCLLFTGVAIELPPGHVGLVMPRSGLTQNGVVPNLGVIDQNYRGEIAVSMPECGGYELNQGDRIAQFVVLPIPALNIVTVDELSESNRGANGFGSSGR